MDLNQGNQVEDEVFQCPRIRRKFSNALPRLLPLVLQPPSPIPQHPYSIINGDPDDPAIIKKKLKPKPRTSSWARPPPQDSSNFRSYHNAYEIAQREKEMKQRQLSNALKDLLNVPRMPVYDDEAESTDDDIVSLPDLDPELCKRMSEELRRALNIGSEEEVSNPLIKEESKVSDTVNEKPAEFDASRNRKIPKFSLVNKNRYD